MFLSKSCLINLIYHTWNPLKLYRGWPAWAQTHKKKKKAFRSFWGTQFRPFWENPVTKCGKSELLWIFYRSTTSVKYPHFDSIRLSMQAVIRPSIFFFSPLAQLHCCSILSYDRLVSHTLTKYFISCPVHVLFECKTICYFVRPSHIHQAVQCTSVSVF